MYIYIYVIETHAMRELAFFALARGGVLDQMCGVRIKPHNLAIARGSLAGQNAFDAPTHEVRGVILTMKIGNPESLL